MATLREGAHFVGLSNSEWLSQRARDHAAKHQMDKQVSFHTIGDEDYQLLGAWPDNCMDAVLWFESVCHLPDKASFFRSVARILKPGGRLGGIDWVQRPWGEYQTEAQIRPFIEANGFWMPPGTRACSRSASSWRSSQVRASRAGRPGRPTGSASGRPASPAAG